MSGKTTDFSAAVQLGALVPAPDATTNVDNRDVVGNKADTEVGTATAANSTLSLMAYEKAMWDLLRVNITGAVAQDSDTKYLTRVALGSMAGTSIADYIVNYLVARLTATRAGYLDNLAYYTSVRAAYIDNLAAGPVAQAATVALAATALSTATWTATRAGNLDVATTSAFGGGSPTTMTSNGSANIKGSYAQVIASTAAACKWLLVQLKPSAAQTYQVDIATGGSGSEVIKIPDLLVGTTANQVISFLVPINIPAATRIAVRCQDSAGGSTCLITVQGF